MFLNYKHVQIRQSKAVRITKKYVKNVKDTSAYFKSLRLFNVGQIRDYEAAVFMFNYVHNLVPETFNEFYRFRSSIHEHDTRRCDDLSVDIQNSVRSGFTLKYLGPSVWNLLPVSVRVAEHLPQFKKD